MTISKTVYEFTVLHRSDETVPDIFDAVIRVHEGAHLIGLQTYADTTPVADEMVPAELVAIGNDGHFFDDDLEDQ